MKKRIFYIISMALLLVTGCYREEFGQIEKEMKELRNTQIAPLSDQLSKIENSLSTLNVLSGELQEYVTQIEQTGGTLQDNIDRINASIQKLKEELSGKNSAEKGQLLAELQNIKAYLEVELANMKSTSDALKEKYNSLGDQIKSLEEIVSGKYSTMDWLNGTFATIEQQNAVIAEVESVRALVEALNSSTFSIQGNVKDYVLKLRDESLGTIEESISGTVKELTAAYEKAVSDAVAGVKEAYSKEIADAIEKSEKKVMEWVNKELDDYLTVSAAEAKVSAYKQIIGNVPSGSSLQDQIDDLTGLIETMKSDISEAYAQAVSDAISESEGKLSEYLTENIASFRTNELKSVTDQVGSLESDVNTLWEDLGKLESRIKTLDEQVAAIETSLAVLDDFNNSLSEYILALKQELESKDNTDAATLQALVATLQNAVNGKDNASSLQALIQALKDKVGTIPQGESSLVSWVENSTSNIDTQLKSYATIAYIQGLQKEIETITDDHTARLKAISERLSTAIDDSKSTVEGWISDALKDYMTASDFDGKLGALESSLKDLFAKGDATLNSSISDLRTDVETAISELKAAYKAKIESAIEEYNGYVTNQVDTKLTAVKASLSALDTRFSTLESTIDVMQDDVTTLNADISALKTQLATLKTFITVNGYTSLKGIVDAITAKLNALSGTYADLDKFTEVDLLVNGTEDKPGYKAAIEKLSTFQTDLEAAENAIDSYQELVTGFELDKNKESFKTLKAQFTALNNDLAALKTSVFGGNLRTQLEAIETAHGNLSSDISSLNDALISRLKSYTSIAFKPENEDGSASFQFDGTVYSSKTLHFDVRPKALASAIAKKAEFRWTSSTTRASSLVSLNKASSTVTKCSDSDGVLEFSVTLPKTAQQQVSDGISLALFASGEGFDFASEFIPVSGDRMYVRPNPVTFESTGGSETVRVCYPQSQSTAVTSSVGGDWITLQKGSSGTLGNGLSYTDYTVTAAKSKSPSERTSTVTFTYKRDRTELSCTLNVNQAPRDAQTFDGFIPASETVVFSWNGYVLGEDGAATDKKSQDITVTTSDGQTDWTAAVAAADAGWAKVETNDKSTKASLSVISDNESGADRIGTIIFKDATETVTSEYKFTQKPRGEQELTFVPTYNSEDGSGGLLFGYEKTENKTGSRKEIEVTSSDGLYDYKVNVDGTQYPWIQIDSTDKKKIRVWTYANDNVIDEEKGDLSRTGYITFTSRGTPVHTYQYPVVQANCPAQTFIFSFSPLDGPNCYLGEDGYIHVSYRGGSKMYVYVKGEPNDDWTMKVSDAGTGSWLSREELTNKSGRSKASFLAPDGFNYYIQITAKEYSGPESTTTDREASIRFTCDGKNYDYKVIQDHKTADIINFAPASGTLVFYWDGRVVGDDGKPTSNTYKDIEVTTGDGSTNWKVEETPAISWAKAEKHADLTGVTARISDVAKNTTGEDRIGTLTFTSSTNKTYTYTFTQQKATQTTASVTIDRNPVEKIILSWDGKKYRTSDADPQWKDITTYRIENVQTFLATVTTDDGSEWNAALDPDKTSSGWGIASAKVSYYFSDYLGLSAYGSNSTDSPRSAEIVISNELGEICRIPVVQEVKQLSVSVTRPTYLEFIKNYDTGSSSSSMRKYRNNPTGQYDQTVSKNSFVTLYVSTTDGQPSDWTCGLAETKAWVSKVEPDSDGNVRVFPATNNNQGAQDEAVINFTYANGNKKGQVFATYKFYKQGRDPYTFKDDFGDKTYDANVLSDSFAVGTSDGSTDWFVKVLDFETETAITDPNFWLKAQNDNGSASLTMTKNETGASRKAKLLFYTFMGEDDAASRKIISVTQTDVVAQQPQTGFKFDSDKATAYLVRDGDNTYTKAASGAKTTVTYSISSGNSAGATIDESTGKVTYTKPGTAVITATAAANADWKSATASYTLTVKNKYKKVTSLTKGRQYVIVSSDYAMKNDKSNTIGKVLASADGGFTISDNMLTFKDAVSSDAALVWSCLQNSSGYMFNNQGWMVHGYSSSNKAANLYQDIASHSNSSAYYTYSNSRLSVAGGGKVLFYSTIYSSWYCYTSSSDRTVDFYESPIDNLEPVTSITISSTSFSLNPGESKQLSVSSIEPYYATDQTVSWSSSNTSVATVDESGKVQAVGAGDATITCRSNDNSASVTCAVKVNTVPATGITVNGLTNNNYNLNLKKSKTEFGSVTLEAALLPDNTTDVLSNVAFEKTKEEQKISGKTVATVTDNKDGTVTVAAKAPGKVTIKVSNGKFEYSFTVTVLQTYTLTTTLPNKSSGTFLIAASSDSNNKTPILKSDKKANTSYQAKTDDGWTYIASNDLSDCECILNTADAQKGTDNHTIKYGTNYLGYSSGLSISSTRSTYNSVSSSQISYKPGSYTYYLYYYNNSSFAFSNTSTSSRKIRWFSKDAPAE